MKKSYSSPQVSFISLGINPLSSACSYISNMAAGVCPVYAPEWGGESIFPDTTVCDWPPAGTNVCYDVPTASSNVFES